MNKDRDEVIRELIHIQYDRNEMDFRRGTFRVRGDVLEIFPAIESELAVRVEFFGDEIERISEMDVLTGEIRSILEHISIFPASHYVVSQDKIQRAAIEDMSAAIESHVATIKDQNDAIKNLTSENEKLLAWARAHGYEQ